VPVERQDRLRSVTRAGRRSLESNQLSSSSSTTMVKISVLQHAPSVRLPERRGDPAPVSRNLDPLMHPFAKARERTRALNAAKMERIFAKPFIASLEGHLDAVEVLTRQIDSLNNIASGSWDGGVCVFSCCPC
jgi:DDB1- and CUL4-associated factor 13